MINIGDLMRAMADAVPQEEVPPECRQSAVISIPSGRAFPQKEEIYDFAEERQIPMYVAVRFYEYYSQRGWRTGNEPIRDWKGRLVAWVKNQRI